jgi:EAL domain-containing protein (putative c-di-GMP-specific phosphodiesterase class I)
MLAVDSTGTEAMSSAIDPIPSKTRFAAAGTALPALSADDGFEEPEASRPSVGRLVSLDDDTLVADLIATIAELCGFDSTTVHTLDGFCRSMDEQGFPEIIVLDLNLGATDGVSALKRLNAMSCCSAILLLSGCDERVINSTVALGRSLGLNMLPPLAKPFDPADLQGALTRFTLGRSALSAAEVRRAVEQNELGVHLQPVLNLKTGRIAGAEALVRWNHPMRGLIMPDRFIPLVEGSPLILPLTLRVAQLAISQIAAIPGRLEVAINVPPFCLADPHFPDQLVELALGHGLDPSRIVVEVTETAAMADPAETISQVTRLRIKGFQVALDDFGTGYSSLVELHRMPASMIKIDRSFVAQILADKAARVIVRSIVALARNLDLMVIAEGVENRETLQMLRSFDCGLAQGYHIARPMAADSFAGWLRSWDARGLEAAVA